MSDPAPRESFRGYLVRRECWAIAGRRFDLTWPADVDGLLDLPAIRERFARDEYMPYWAQPWPASVLLAETLLRGEDGQGRTAIELGCGVGLVSLAAAMAGWSVIASDYDDDAVAFTRLNAERNGLRLAGCQRIDYRIPLPEPVYNRVFGSDLTYERRRSEPVAKWLASALLPGGVALISDPNRSAGDDFPDCVRAAGLRIDAEQVETTAPAGLVNRGRIWRVYR